MNQPAGAGFLVYRMAGSWRLAADGSLISGVDSVQILDADHPATMAAFDMQNGFVTFP